jgi:His-Xaa-Ser system protein HxsD
MSEATTLFDEAWASIELDEDLYPEDAVKGAAYVFLDRAYVFLERAADRRLRVRVKAKSGGDTRALAGELENEALAQAYRRRIAVEKQSLLEGVAYRAIAGAAGPPGLDDLLAMDIGAETAFDDPLGIAMSWEEKYAKKKAPAEEASAEGEAAKPEGTPEQKSVEPEPGK